MLHRFSLNGYNIALDVCTGVVHVLDDLSYKLSAYADENMSEQVPQDAFTDLSDTYVKEEIIETWSELFELYKSGIFCSKDDIKKYVKNNSKAPIKSMCLNVAHDCNLRCKYCFASTGDFGGGRKLMPFEVGKAALDFIVKNSGTRHNLEVDFFGGEPLMNFGVVKRLVEYGRKIEKENNKHFRFTITTNGILLDDEKIDFINREMHNVVLSIDGRREINDEMRPHVDGRGSYDDIIGKYKKLVENRNGGEYYVRGTFTHKNLDFAEDVLHLADEGFDQISVEPVVCDRNSPYAIQKEDLPRIFEEYEKLASAYLSRRREGKGFNFFHFMIDLNEGPCILKLLKGCGCGNEYVAVTPDGEIYPCHQFVGQSNFIMGNVLEQSGNFENELKIAFSKANIFTKKSCPDCWARFFCSGGCNANNQLYNENILNPLEVSCKLEKKRLECALMIKAALAE